VECDVCKMELNKTEFKKHQLIHKADSYNCDTCEAKFKHRKPLENHVKSKHEWIEGEMVKEGSESTKQHFESDPLPKATNTNKDNQNIAKTEVKLTSFANLFINTSFGNSKPRKIAYVKPQIKDVSGDSRYKELKRTDNKLPDMEDQPKDPEMNLSNTQTSDYTEQNLNAKGRGNDSRMNECFDDSNHSNSEVATENSLKKKKVACKTCKACKAEDCGVCVYCVDKPKFGGPSKLRQRCLQRICLQSGITPMKKFMLKRLEVESTKIIQKNLQDKKEKSKPVFSNKVKDDKIKDNREKEKKIKAVKEEKEKKENSQRIKPKIKLRPPVSNPDSSEKLSLKEIASQDITPTDENPKKRTNDEIDKKNDRMHKKIKIEANMAIKAKLATSEEVDELIKNEVDEKVGLEKSFREKLDEDLMNLIDWDTEDGYAVDLDISVPPRTPKKWW